MSVHIKQDLIYVLERGRKMGWSSPRPPAAVATSEQPAHKTKQIKSNQTQEESEGEEVKKQRRQGEERREPTMVGDPRPGDGRRGGGGRTSGRRRRGPPRQERTSGRRYQLQFPDTKI